MKCPSGRFFTTHPTTTDLPHATFCAPHCAICTQTSLLFLKYMHNTLTPGIYNVSTQHTCPCHWRRFTNPCFAVCAHLSDALSAAMDRAMALTTAVLIRDPPSSSSDTRRCAWMSKFTASLLNPVADTMRSRSTVSTPATRLISAFRLDMICSNCEKSLIWVWVGGWARGGRGTQEG